MNWGGGSGKDNVWVGRGDRAAFSTPELGCSKLELRCEDVVGCRSCLFLLPAQTQATARVPVFRLWNPSLSFSKVAGVIGNLNEKLLECDKNLGDLVQLSRVTEWKSKAQRRQAMCLMPHRSLLARNRAPFLERLYEP